jgi:hypothetical protein
VPVLAEVATSVSPVMRGTVKDHEVRGGGMVEELCEVFERMGVGVGPATRMGVGHLLCELPEVRGILAGHRVLTIEQTRIVAPVLSISSVRTPVPAEPEVAVRRGHVIGVGCG